MSVVESRIKELGLELPPAPKPMASYVPWVRTGNLVFISGQGPVVGGEIRYVGRVGDNVSLDEAREAARITCLNVLAVAKSAASDLDRVLRVVKLTGYVRSAPGFTDQPKVVNGASDLLQEVFGEKGKHARAAVGVGELPMGMCVEIEAVVEVE